MTMNISMENYSHYHIYPGLSNLQLNPSLYKYFSDYMILSSWNDNVDDLNNAMLKVHLNSRKSALIQVGEFVHYHYSHWYGKLLLMLILSRRRILPSGSWMLGMETHKWFLQHQDSDQYEIEEEHSGSSYLSHLSQSLQPAVESSSLWILLWEHDFLQLQRWSQQHYAECLSHSITITTSL